MINLTLGTLTTVITIFETKSIRAIRACCVVHAVTQASPILILDHTALVCIIVMLIISKTHDLNGSI